MKYRLRCIATIGMLGLGASPAIASFFDGNKMLEACEKYPEAAAGYAMGVVDVATVAGQTGLWRPICLPLEVLGTQVRDVICKFIEENPADRHWDAGALANNAIRQAWPCSQ